MNELLTTPLSRPDDLGKPIPNCPHATSVCMPEWADNIGYEEGDLRVINKLTCGYPRFVYHPFVEKFFSECERRFAKDDERCIALPSENVAKKCRLFLKKNGFESTIHDIGIHHIHCVTFPGRAADLAKCFWQHSGDILSSRQAYSALEHRDPIAEGSLAKTIIRERIARYVECSPEHVFLFPSGMSAIFNLFQILKELLPNRKSVQFGFPYVDTLKIQQKFDMGVHFFPKGDEKDLHDLNECLSNNPIVGIFCEFPMNPLMKSPNLEQLAYFAKKYKVPLIVDDTISTFHNIHIIPPADILVTSLTKFFSGAGDVMGGAIIIKPENSFTLMVSEKLNYTYEDNLWPEDAEILEKNSRDFTERMTKINNTAEKVCDYLHDHPMIQRLFYPKFVTRNNYDDFKKSGAGYGGVFSLIVNDSTKNVAKFFNSLMISKGPSLGTNFSLACPYTILAHYHEIDFVESCGLSKDLIRISVGLEVPGDLISRFEHAFSACRY